MARSKPVLILQLRPEDATSDSEYRSFLKYAHLQEEGTCRLRIENTGIPDDLNDGRFAFTGQIIIPAIGL